MSLVWGIVRIIVIRIAARPAFGRPNSFPMNLSNRGVLTKTHEKSIKKALLFL